MIKKLILPCFVLFGIIKSTAQIQTSEDSLMIAGKEPATYVGGYGNAFYQLNSNEHKSEINLERVVLFLGHRFNDKFSFFSEIEIEDAKVSGGEEGGELAIEQAYLKCQLTRSSYLTAGLFLPRIGILNENHLPNSFNGNERTQVETYLIPSTWRELGIGFYTRLNSLPVEISLAAINGLNSSGFEHGTFIRGGRYEGSKASANNLAFTGAALFDMNNFKIQISGYTGGSVGLSPKEADSLNLESGLLGTPVIMGEADVQYANNGITVRILGTFASIPDAGSINKAYANNTAESAYGFYAEAGYDLLFNREHERKKSLIAFVRYEKFDLNATIPANGIEDPVLDQQHIIAGFTYLPIANIAVKADVRLSSTGDQNPALTIVPDPNAPPFKNENSYVNIGFGFSF